MFESARTDAAVLATTAFLLVTTDALAMPFTATACDVAGNGTEAVFDLYDNVTNTLDCQYADGPSNNLNDRNNNINDSSVMSDPGFFGHQDWIQTNTYFDSGYGNTITGFNIAVDLGLSFGANDDVMLLFKDGNNTSTWVTYIVDDWTADFSVTTNMWEELYGQAKAISHISVYYRDGGTNDVPEPGVPALLALGLLALQLARVRHRTGPMAKRTHHVAQPAG